MSLIDPVIDTIDGILAWIGSSLGQLAENYCDLETADSPHVLVAKDGSLVSVLRIHGATFLVGPDEFERMHKALSSALQTCLSRTGQAIQVYFCHDKELVKRELEYILSSAKQTAQRLSLSLDDLFEERITE